MRRPPYHHSYHRSHHYAYRHAWGRHPARRSIPPFLLLLGLMMVAGGAALIAVLLAAALSFGLVGVAGVATVVLVSRGRRRRRRLAGQRHRTRVAAGPVGAVDPAGAVGPAAPPVPPVPDWAATRARFAQLRSEYGQFECDPLAVLRLPALADVTVPSTGRFVDAFAEAQALDTDTAPPPGHAARFATAVDNAWRAWHAARDAAERIRLAGVPPEERATVQRAIKLLTVARDSAHDAERIAAYSRARVELAKLERTGTVRMPSAAAAALDAAARGQLPPAAVG